MDDVIEHTLQDNVHVYVILSEDVAAEQKISGDKSKKRKWIIVTHKIAG